MTAYIKGQRTMTKRVEKAERLEFPTITICLDPGIKNHVAKKYGFTGFSDPIRKKVPNKTISEIQDELSYVLNKDIYIETSDGNRLVHGISQKYQVSVSTIRSNGFGNCFKMEPLWEIFTVPLRISYIISLNTATVTNEQNRPKSVIGRVSEASETTLLWRNFVAVNLI